MIKKASCLSRGPELSSQQPHEMTHDYLLLLLEGTRYPLLTFTDSYMCMSSNKDTHKIFRKRYFSFNSKLIMKTFTYLEYIHTYIIFIYTIYYYILYIIYSTYIILFITF